MTFPTRPLTIREATFFWRQVRPALRHHLDIADGISELAETFHAQGMPSYESASRIAASLIKLESEGVQMPFGDPDAPISRAVRQAANAIATGAMPEPPAEDLLAANAARSAAATFDPWARFQQLHGESVARIDGEIGVRDSRDDRSLDHQQPAPSLVMEGGVPVRFLD